MQQLDTLAVRVDRYLDLTRIIWRCKVRGTPLVETVSWNLGRLLGRLQHERLSILSDQFIHEWIERQLAG